MMFKVDKILPDFIEEGFEFFEITKLKMIYIFCFSFGTILMVRTIRDGTLATKTDEQQDSDSISLSFAFAPCTRFWNNSPRTQILSHAMTHAKQHQANLTKKA